MRKHVFDVTFAHTTYGKQYTSYTVLARSATDAIAIAAKLAGPGEYAFEVKHVTTIDKR